MNSTSHQSESQFREEVREWVEANRPVEPRPVNSFDDERQYDLEWQKIQFEGGWAGLSWPKEYGGQDLSLLQQLAWYEEAAKARCPSPAATICYLGLNHAGPTVMKLGSEEHKSFHLPKILKGETAWCQGFSEPNSGSDLASLRTKGTVDGDVLVINGQKTWTSHAHLCDYQELLVRTDPDSERHSGLTWIVGNMRLPGMDIRPIKSLEGVYHNCEVFYDDVRIPLSSIVGGLNNGWRVARTTLGFERATANIGIQTEFVQFVEDVIDYARDNIGPDGRRPIIDHGDIAIRLAEARAETQAMRAMVQLTLERAEGGQVPGSESSIMRLFHTELVQRVCRLAIDILGVKGLKRSAKSDWTHQYLFTFCETIAGGTSEIQRNVIGDRVLGLPR